MMQQKNDKGFTLIESLIAIFIVAMGALGIVSFLGSIMRDIQPTSDKLVAGYLAQEGLEIVRNIRDSNFIKVHKSGIGAWTDGLSGCASGCEGDWRDYTLSPFLDRYLNFDSVSANPLGYNYGAGDSSKFKRKITIIPEGAEILSVTVDVSWQDGGTARKFSAVEKLYKWFQ